MVAVLALYAVLLQAFLGGLMPVPASADGICAHHAASDPGPGKAVPHGHGDCCMTAQAIGAMLAPREAPGAVVWFARGSAPARRDRCDSRLARPPPDGGASPRGPPTA